MLIVASLTACGGGGGNGGSGSTTSSLILTLSTHTVTVSATTAQAAPAASLNIELTNPNQEKVYVLFSGTQKVITGLSLTDETATSATVAISLQSPSNLTVGTYSDTVTINVCSDVNCTQPVQNSPQTATVQYTITAAPPAATITTLTPATVDAGAASFILTIEGTNFNSKSVVQVNGSPRQTTFVSATELSAAITAGDVVLAGTDAIAVSNAAIGGNTTAGAILTVQVFVLTSLSPNTLPAGATGFVLTVNGNSFVPTSVVEWNGTPLASTYVATNRLTAQVSTADVMASGSASVSVSTPGIGGGTTSGLTFTIQPIPALSLGSVQPAWVTAGNGPFLLNVTGAGFTSTTTVQWNGSPRPTSYVSSTQVTAQISGSDVSAPGTASITVANAGGAATGSTQVTINPFSKDAVALQIDTRHSGTMTFNSLTLPVSSAWTSTDLGGTPSYPLIAAGMVFITSSISNTQSQLFALDQATGAVVWDPVSIPGASNAAYDASTVFVVSSIFGQPGLMQAFNAADGSLKWSTSLTGQYTFTAPPTAAAGLVFTGGSGSGGTLYALDETSGAVTWSRQVVNGDFSAPAVSADGVYVSYPDWTYDFVPWNGDPLWRNATSGGGGGGATPVVANGTLYSPNGVNTYSGTTFDAETGTVTGTYAADNMPAIGTQSGYFLQGGVLRSLALSTGNVNWSFNGDGLLVTSPLVVNQVVFVGSSSGNLYGVDTTAGTQLWQVNLGAALSPGPTFGVDTQITALAAGDGLLIVPTGHQITAFVLSTNP